MNKDFTVLIKKSMYTIILKQFPYFVVFVALFLDIYPVFIYFIFMYL
jgi:hypothetical protein